MSILSDFEFGLQEIVKQLNTVDQAPVNPDRAIRAEYYSINGAYLNRDEYYSKCIDNVFSSELYTEELFEKYPVANQYREIYKVISRNVNISLEYIINHMDKSWNHKSVSERHNITQSDLRNYPQIQWDIIKLSITWSNPPESNYPPVLK